MASTELIKAIAVTAELCGRTFSPEAARVFVEDLAGFEEPAILKALSRCRKEVRGLMTLQDVISRIDDGRPGPEEAWAMIPKTEAETVVWTNEMAMCSRPAMVLLEGGDKVGARMAFKEAYTAAVSAARDRKEPVRWSASLGHDKFGREQVLKQAAELGRISYEEADEHCPGLIEYAPKVQKIVNQAAASLRLVP